MEVLDFTKEQSLRSKGVIVYGGGGMGKDSFRYISLLEYHACILCRPF